MALECYECFGTHEDDCKKSTLEGNKGKYLKTCSAGVDKCVRTLVKTDDSTVVSNTCTTQMGCDSAQAVCDNYAAGRVTCKVGCCDEDACNVGSHVFFNVFLLTVCSALCLALLM